MTAPYPFLERLLHRLAFGTLPAQITLTDMERLLWGRRFSKVTVDNSVFITALPRSGTTLLLELLAKMPEFATHTYRNMPFVLTPLLWECISASFRKADKACERLHGDGLSISHESPEAFEEVVWKTYWPGHYRDDRIVPWEDTHQYRDFLGFFTDHMRKIIALRSHSQPPKNGIRYLSKNNANIARLGTLSRSFPNGHILIMLRHPWQHAESLRRQHKQFTKIHATDPFARQYMEWIGHHEFGATLRPIDFGNWLDKREELDPQKPPYWLAYWHAAYTAVASALRHDANCKVTLVDYDTLCKKPGKTLSQLAERLGIEDPEQLLNVSDGIRSSRAYELKEGIASSTLYKTCIDLYDDLLSKCLITPAS